MGISTLHRDLKNIAMILFELTTYKINKMILQYKVYVKPDKTLSPLITTHWKVPQMESFEIKREKIFYRSPICEINAQTVKTNFLWLWNLKTGWYVCFPRRSLHSVNLLHPVKLPQSWLGTPLFYFSPAHLLFFSLVAFFKQNWIHIFVWHWKFLRNRAETSLTHLERKINLLREGCKKKYRKSVTYNWWSRHE